jgi:hypothetical protein
MRDAGRPEREAVGGGNAVLGRGEGVRGGPAVPTGAVSSQVVM